MRWVSSIVAVVALAASLPATAYSTRYEVRHYPAAFTRTVNQSLGTTIENYADGKVTLNYGTMPAPSLSVTAVETGSVGFDIDSSFEFTEQVAPVSAAAQALFVALGQHPAHIKIGEAKGVIMLTAPAASGTALSAMVDQPRGTGFSVECQDGVSCGTTHYHTALFLDALVDNPYACGATCPSVAPGTPLNVFYDMTAHVQVYGGSGSTAALLIDPTISLDPGFLADAGLTTRDFAITPEAGFGNSGGSVAEPASWILLIAGFAAVGIALRQRPLVTA